MSAESVFEAPSIASIVSFSVAQLQGWYHLVTERRPDNDLERGTPGIILRVGTDGVFASYESDLCCCKRHWLKPFSLKQCKGHQH